MSYRYRGYRPKQNKQTRQERQPRQKKYEETGLILDILEGGLSVRNDKYKGRTIIQAIGTEYFTLLEFIPISTDEVILLDEVVLGQNDRSIVETIIGRVPYPQLTSVSESQIPKAVEKIINLKFDKYINWLNNAQPISIRLHSLQLIKGIGPIAMKTILSARKERPFSTLEDFEERTGITDIKELLRNRIVAEISDPDEKHNLFTRVSRQKHQFKQEKYLN